MGCYPLGKLVSKALGRRNGNERRRRRLNRTVLMSPPPSYSHARSAIKTVTFSNDNPVIIIPPDPTPTSSGSKHHHRETVISPSVHASTAAGEAGDDKDDHPQPRPTAFGPEAHGGAPYGHRRHCYMMSPLPGWEDGDRRRREYFGGEYRYYPTPVREGIYNIATDANRLTSMFSEENPNACSIV